MTRTSTPPVIAGLAARLTDTQDRETYAALVSYVNELPPGDEFRHLMEMLGLVSLMGQRLPDALAELLAELRAQAKAAGDYHAQVDARLADLPQQIAEGVDPVAIAKEMSEVFRQRLADTGLRDVTVLLKTTTGDIKSLANDANASLKPAAAEIRGVMAAISTEIRKLVAAARDVEQHNRRLIQQKLQDGWIMKALVVLIVFLVGGVCGIVFEKRQTGEALANVGAQLERLQTPTPLPMAVTPRNNGRKQGL